MAPPPNKAARPWYKKKRFIVPAVFLAFIILIAQCTPDAPTATGPADPAPATTQAETSAAPTTTAAASKAPATKAPATKAPEPKPKPALAGIGTTVVAGDWAFKVTKFKCGASKVGKSEYLQEEAQGQFCLMNLSVTNNGNAAAYLSSANQKILDKDGKTYSSDSEASIYADAKNSLLSEEINPGNTAKGLIVFDVPQKVTPTEAALAGGLFGIKDVAKVDLR
jgi:hypothetical protein